MLFSSSLAVLIPVWTPGFLPLQDWPQHLAAASVLANFDDPAFQFQRYLSIDPHITTFMTFYWGTAFLSNFLPVDAAARLLLSLFFVGAPLSFVYLLRSFEKPPHLALLGFPALFGWPFYLGFVSYLLAVPLLFLGLGLTQRLLQAPSPRRFALLVLLCIATFFTHALLYFVLGLCMLLLAGLAARRSLRRAAVTLAGGIPSLPFFVVWVVRSYDLIQAPGESAGPGPSILTTSMLRGVEYNPLSTKLSMIGEYFNEGLKGDADQWIAVLWLAAYLAVLVTGLGIALAGLRRRPATWRSRLFAFGRPAACGLLLGLFYFVLPLEIFGVWAVSARMVFLGVFGLLLLVPRLFPKNWQNALLLLPAYALTLYTAGVNRNHFAAFDREARGFGQVLRELPPGQRVYGLVFDNKSEVMSRPVYVHFPAYYMVERGGIVGFTFFHCANPTVPIRLKNPAELPYPGFSGDWNPIRWRYDIYGAFYDLLIVRRLGIDPTDPRLLVSAPPQALEPLAGSGLWLAYRNHGVSRERALYSFLEELPRARVTQERDRERVACIPDGQVWRCPQSPENPIGPSIETLGHFRVPCIWTSVGDGHGVTIRYADLPAGGTRIRGLAGVDNFDYQFQSLFGEPIALDIAVNQVPLETIQVGARPGYQTFEISVPPELRPVRRVSFRTTPGNRAAGSVCFAATLFGRPAEEPDRRKTGKD